MPDDVNGFSYFYDKIHFTLAPSKHLAHSDGDEIFIILLSSQDESARTEIHSPRSIF